MINQLVSSLPEVYQSIYGHPELSDQSARQCVDRLEHIAQVHDALQKFLGRPLKVLDLGCAQGFFSLSLAKRGAIVHGLDFLDKNIAVCNALAQEHPEFNISFETGRIEGLVQRLRLGEYDLILGLSVFHHLVHEHGISAVKALLSHAATQCGVLVVELALHEEPLYWAAAQPKDPRELLDDIAFVHECARHGTHLAAIERPLFVASNRYWIFHDQIAQFDTWSSSPHTLAQTTHQGSRRYFFAKNSILKLYRLDHPRGKYNKKEFANEIDFLQAPPKEYLASKIIAHGISNSEAWVVMQRLPGRLLLDMIREGAAMDGDFILRAVLAQLVILESVGLYHADIRTWNILVSDDGTIRLIDYGSISTDARDCVWPGNLFLAFFIFVREVVTGVVDDPIPLRTISISPFGLPEPYRKWAAALWERPVEQWSFRLMHDSLLALSERTSEERSTTPNEIWMKAMEEAIDIQKSSMRGMEAKAQQAEAKAQQAEEAASKAHLAQLQAVYDSMSWRITAPLRKAANLLMHSAGAVRKSANTLLGKGIDTFQRPLSHAMAAVLRRPQLSQRIDQWLLDHCPRLHDRLLTLAEDAGIVVPGSGPAESQGAQSPPDGFSAFVAGFLTFTEPTVMPPMLRRHGQFHGQQLQQRTSQFAGLRLDHQLIHAIQRGCVVQARAYATHTDEAAARHLIRHLHLALLRRYPSEADQREYLKRFGKGERFESMVDSMKTSKDYEAIEGWKWFTST